MAVTRSFRSHSASGVRLSLQTIFSHSPLQRSSKHRKLMATTPSSFNSSPASSFSDFTGKSQEADGAHGIYSPTSTNPRNLVRRQPSAIDLALEEEQSADHVELIGLGLLEPRPRANTGSSSSSSQCSMMEFIAESMQSPTVLDGIFEVMERA